MPVEAPIAPISIVLNQLQHNCDVGNQQKNFYQKVRKTFLRLRFLAWVGQVREVSFFTGRGGIYL